MASNNNGKIPTVESDNIVTPEKNIGGSEKKKKYVSIYSPEGNAKVTILIPGRHKCDCEALKHKLINNCSNCGRIVCEQEGSGPCSFCGNLVYTKEERQILNRGTKKSETLLNVLKNTKRIEADSQNSLMKAIDHKNKLLEYDKTSEQRTKVYDDQSDYFQTNSKWINPTNKAKLQTLEKEYKEKKYDRINRRVTIDLLGRKLGVDNDYAIDELDLNELLKADSNNSNFDTENSISQLPLERPIFVESVSDQKDKSSITIPMSIKRIQDKEIMEMCDDGMCLSMHQPWASLLVRGIKKHEGRVWYSSHRGRLWIASAARPAIDEEIINVENMYRSIYNNDTMTFPQNYPAGCLLGCVHIEDILPQEEYQSLHPKGESESPYVFLCTNPMELPMKFPMKGEHKIFKLNSQLHKAAKNSLKGLMN